MVLQKPYNFLKSVLVNRVMNTEIGEFHRKDAEDAEFSNYFSALFARRFGRLTRFELTEGQAIAEGSIR